MKCKYCGADVPENSVDCPACGKRKTVIISRHTMPPAEPQNCVSRRDIYNVINKATENSGRAELRRRLKVYGVVIAIAAAVLAVWLCVRVLVFHI